MKKLFVLIVIFSYLFFGILYASNVGYFQLVLLAQSMSQEYFPKVNKITSTQLSSDGIVTICFEPADISDPSGLSIPIDLLVESDRSEKLQRLYHGENVFILSRSLYIFDSCAGEKSNTRKSLGYDNAKFSFVTADDLPSHAADLLQSGQQSEARVVLIENTNENYGSSIFFIQFIDSGYAFILPATIISEAKKYSKSEASIAFLKDVFSYPFYVFKHGFSSH